MWSQIIVRSSIRLTGGRQIDFKVSGHFWMPRKYFRKLKLKLKLKLKFQNSENRSRQFFNRKSKQIFSQKVNKYFMSTNWLWSQINPLLPIRAPGAEINDFKELNAKSERIKYYKKNFHHFFTVKLCTAFVLVLCFLCIKIIFRTSSPPTSCYRLGLCPSTPSRSWWSWSTSGLKNRPSVTITLNEKKPTY
jgi:hypothetical protein